MELMRELRLEWSHYPYRWSSNACWWCHWCEIIIDERDIAWINSLNCLKNCGMSIAEMKEYIELCLVGESTIPERKVILDIKRKSLVEQLKQVQDCIDYIDWKQSFYDDVLSGKTKYYSNLINTEE